VIEEIARVLPVAPFSALADYEAAGGGRGLDAARKLGDDAVVEHVLASGLRGRGGAGFPTGRKWAAVRAYESQEIEATVVVNAAEGEPGSFKDRVILRRNPYAVLEGAIIAAKVVDAERIVVAMKNSFGREADVVEQVIREMRAAGWFDSIDVVCFRGPREYLYGEETGLLEAIDGRPPFPRIAPPYRHGVEEVSEDTSLNPARVVLADAGGATVAPPTLVNNVETLANVPGIIANGPDWFREYGTTDSPGTIVCTVSGSTRRAGVAEVPMGTALGAVIDAVGGGARDGRRLTAAVSGVANPVVTVDQFDVALTYEAMQAIGSGLGAAGFIVFDDATDMAAVAHGVARFLSVESCGQCTPCKQDGLALAQHLDRIRRSEAREDDLRAVDDRLRTVADSARCYLATQQQRVVGSIVERFRGDLHAHVTGARHGADRYYVAAIAEIADDAAEIDERQRDKQPDWTFEPLDSGKAPVERLEVRDTERERPRVAARSNAPAPPPEPPETKRPAHDVPVSTVHGTPVDELDADDPEAALYTSEPIDTDDGPVVIQQQNVGRGNEEGGGEWPDPHTPPHAVEPD
jgi:NADH-quinone oxidoreductase subunit F